MEKLLPALNDDPVVQEYMDMLFKSEKKKEYNDTEELLQYISSMEQQFEEVVKELHDVKELLNGLQNPSTKMRVTDAVDKVQVSIDNGKDKLNKLKDSLISSMKECLSAFKQKGKDGVIKTINILHFKESLGEIRKSLFVGMNKTNHLVQTCNAITSEMRKAKRNFKNVVLLMTGKPVQKYNEDKTKLSLIQKCSRAMLSSFKTMATKTTKALHRLEDFEKPSVKTEIKLLKNSEKLTDLKIHKNKEHFR